MIVGLSVAVVAQLAATFTPLSQALKLDISGMPLVLLGWVALGAFALPLLVIELHKLVSNAVYFRGRRKRKSV